MSSIIVSHLSHIVTPCHVGHKIITFTSPVSHFSYMSHFSDMSHFSHYVTLFHYMSHFSCYVTFFLVTFSCIVTLFLSCHTFLICDTFPDVTHFPATCLWVTWKPIQFFFPMVLLWHNVVTMSQTYNCPRQQQNKKYRRGKQWNIALDSNEILKISS